MEIDDDECRDEGDSPGRSGSSSSSSSSSSSGKSGGGQSGYNADSSREGEDDFSSITGEEKSADSESSLG